MHHALRIRICVIGHVVVIVIAAMEDSDRKAAWHPIDKLDKNTNRYELMTATAAANTSRSGVLEIVLLMVVLVIAVGMMRRRTSLSYSVVCDVGDAKKNI
jgi:hypothetical protein